MSSWAQSREIEEVVLGCSDWFLNALRFVNFWIAYGYFRVGYDVYMPFRDKNREMTAIYWKLSDVFDSYNVDN